MTPISDAILIADLSVMWADFAVDITYKEATASTVNVNTGEKTETYTSHSIQGIIVSSSDSTAWYKKYLDSIAVYDKWLHLRSSDIAFTPEVADIVVISAENWVVEYVALDGSSKKWLLGLKRAS